MQLGDLRQYGISERMIEVWRNRQGDSLLPVQRRAVRQGLLDPARSGFPRNAIVAAPTSAGKSFCGELACARALAARRRVVMVFPLKSLVEQKYALFRRTYEPLGLKCLILTSDHPDNDRRFLAGDYHIALAVQEKFDLALAGRLDILHNIGLVVVDELQTISEPGRGAVLERLLTRILASTYRPEIVGLSAVLVDQCLDPLAEWLDAMVVEETSRPRELIRGVVADGRLTYRNYNDGCSGSAEIDSSCPVGDPEQTAAWLASRIKADSGRTLVFLKSRADTVQLSLRLAAALGRRGASDALRRLDDEEPSFLLRSLTQVLGHGVAFHNSDLSARQRTVVEDAFCSGEVTVLCATTTLALGVNLPADTVYLETVKYASGEYDSRPELVPISRAEFDNMTGRAGRLGFGIDTPGRAFVLAESAFESDVLWNAYIAPCRPGRISSAWESMPVDDWLLHMIVCGLVRTAADPLRVYARTLHARLRNSSDEHRDDQFDFGASLERLREAGLVGGNDPAIAPTALGTAVVTSGLAITDAVHYRKCLDDDAWPESSFGWTCFALGSTGWAPPPGILAPQELAGNGPVRMLYRRFDHAVEEAVPLLPEDHRQRPLGFRAAAALKAALLLDEWCRLVPAQKIEEGYRLHLGQVQYLGRTAAHLVSAVGRLIGSLDHESDRPRYLAELAFSLRFGLPPTFRELHRHFGEILSRSDFQSLRAAGIESPEAFSGLSETELDRIISNQIKSHKIRELLHNLEEEVDMQPAVLDVHTPFGRQPGVIEIDGTYEADRYLVRIDGFPVRLTGKSFKYLTRLAWSRLNNAGGWVYKEDIEVGFNQARYLYRMKNEINAGIRSNWPVVENNRLGYYRLQIDPEKIRLNVDNLKAHPDYELRSLFESGGRSAAVH